MTTTDHLQSTPAEPPADEGRELAALVVPLLKGVIYREDEPGRWQTLLNLQARVRDYVAVLDLELILDEAEGYAFLRSRPSDEQEPAAAKVPRLMARRRLSFPVSLLLALLRKKLAEFDAGAGGGDSRLVLGREEIVELIRVFLPAGSNETRLFDQVDSHLNKIAELGFIRRLRGAEPLWEVRRIIKAFVDAQWLAEFDQHLEEYRQHLADPAAPASPEQSDPGGKGVAAQQSSHSTDNGAATP